MSIGRASAAVLLTMGRPQRLALSGLLSQKAGFTAEINSWFTFHSCFILYHLPMFCFDLGYVETAS